MENGKPNQKSSPCFKRNGVYKSCKIGASFLGQSQVTNSSVILRRYHSSFKGVMSQERVGGV